MVKTVCICLVDSLDTNQWRNLVRGAGNIYPARGGLEESEGSTDGRTPGREASDGKISEDKDGKGSRDVGSMMCRESKVKSGSRQWIGLMNREIVAGTRINRAAEVE